MVLMIDQSFDEDYRWQDRIIKIQEHKVAVLGGMCANIKRNKLPRSLGILLHLKNLIKLRCHNRGATNPTMQHCLIQQDAISRRVITLKQLLDRKSTRLNSSH